MLRMKIVVLCGAVEKYINRCIDSYLRQSYVDWDMQVMIDPMGDSSYERAIEYKNDKIDIHLNESRRWALGNTVKGIELLNPEDEDIVITMDGDDWLSGNNSLEIVAKNYKNFNNLLLTHGSWTAWPNPNVPENNAPYTILDYERNIRKTRWRASQLRTFKYKLWKHIEDKDLRDMYGNYFRAAGDCAYMWPMMEMAGFDRVKFINDRIYTYNQENPYGDSVYNVREQMFFTDYIAAMTPYKYKENL